MDSGKSVSFQSIAPSAVRSIKQRDLLNTWLRAYIACGNSVPRFDMFQPDRISDETPDLVYCRIEHQSEHPHIMIESDGTRLSDAYGRRGQGQELSAYLGPRHAPNVVPIYRACISRGLPAYSISEVSDASGVKVDYERLLLPFADAADPVQVSRVLASLKTISEDGTFILRNLMRGSEKTPTFRLRGIIDHDLVDNRIAHGMPADGDVVEFT